MARAMPWRAAAGQGAALQQTPARDHDGHLFEPKERQPPQITNLRKEANATACRAVGTIFNATAGRLPWPSTFFHATRAMESRKDKGCADAFAFLKFLRVVFLVTAAGSEGQRSSPGGTAAQLGTTSSKARPRAKGGKGLPRFCEVKG